MTTHTPLVIVNDQLQRLPSGASLGPVAPGTATGEVMTQDQFGANSTEMTSSGSPHYDNLHTTILDLMNDDSSLNNLRIAPEDDRTAHRLLTLSIGDANRSLTITGNATLVAGTMAPTSGKLSQFASTTSAELAGVISDETGSGALVFAASPALTGTATLVNASLSGNLIVNGNTTLGDASGDSITQYAATRRLVSGETITVDSASSTAEVLQTWKLSDDAVGKFEIINSSATDGLFSPTFRGTRASAGPGINFIGNSTTDTGTNGVLLFQAQIGGGNVSTRPLFDMWNNGTSAFSIAANGDLSQKVVGNGQALTFATQTELLTIAAAATSDTTFNLPAGAVIFAVSVRVTVVIPTASTFTVTGATSATAFNTAAVSTAANTTDKGTAAGAYYNASAQHVRITPNLTPSANTGRVRVTAHYYQITAATS